MTHRTVIIGAGIAGVSAAAALRGAGYDGDITIAGDEPELPYRRPPVSKEVLRGEKGPDDIRIHRPEWYEQRGITLRTGARAASIEIDARIVRFDEDDAIFYDHLLLATGGRARALAQTDGAGGVCTLRGLSDVPRLTAHLTSGSPLVVVGAGLIGAEIASAARELGCDVTVLESADRPLSGLLPAEIGDFYADLHRSHGVDLQTGVLVSAVESAGQETIVRSVDGRSWSAPVVVVAIGMEPNTDLAEASGIALVPAGQGGGIEVDAFGRTSAPGVFAAGDVANQPRPVLGGRHRVEHWQGAQNHGTAVGKAMAGPSAPFGEVPWCWSDQYGLNLQVVGWPLAGVRTVLRGSLADRDFTMFLLDGEDVVRGAITVGRPSEIRAAKSWIAASERLDAGRLADDSADLLDAVLE